MQITNYEQCGTKYLPGFFKESFRMQMGHKLRTKSAKFRQKAACCVAGNNSFSFVHIEETA